MPHRAFSRRPAVLGLAAALALAATSGLLPVAPARAAEGVLVIGRVGNNPARQLPQMQTFAQWLAPRLAPAVTKIETMIFPSLGDLLGAMEQGRVDLVSETPFSAMALEEKGGRIALREWRSGEARYHTVFFAKTGAPVAALADLVGRKIAFEDPGSTSAFMLPYAEIARAGLRTTALTSIREDAPRDAVGYAFLRGESNMAFAVANGLADVGAFSNGDWADLEKAQPQTAGALRIFHRTPDVTRSLIVIRDALPPTVRGKLEDALLAIADDPAGRAALQGYTRGTRIDRIDATVERELADARALFAAARSTLLDANR